MLWPVTDPAAISPTAHYTGYVWFRNGLSHPELATGRGRVLFETLRPAMAVSRTLGGPTLEDYLLARHRALDAVLTRAIEELGVTQVIEVACGLSPRGWRFAQTYGERLTYVEADLPDMAATKRQALERMGSLSDRHRVVEMDALRDDGPGSLASVAGTLNADEGLAIITEGLLGYFEHYQVLGMWRRFARALSEFPTGRYLADTYFEQDAAAAHVQAFRTVLSVFVRGRVHVHFADAAEATSALEQAGFTEAAVCRADEVPDAGADGRERSARLARIIDAGVARLSA
jgi:O-methyltransferase involved in polyketide biosynthesis